MAVTPALNTGENNFFRFLMCTGAHGNPAACGSNNAIENDDLILHGLIVEQPLHLSVAPPI